MIGMEASRFNDEERALKTLLDLFGSAFSLDELASAFCKAGRDPDLAVKSLLEMQASSSASSSTTADEAKGIELSSGSSFEGKEDVNDHLRLTNQKSVPASIGSVSSVIGKGYVQTIRPKNGSCVTPKPVKLDSSVIPESELWGEDVNSNSNLKKNDTVHRDMEEFLFSILGSGFMLDRAVIREVLDACGYDMPKSMEKLSDLSTDAFDRRNNHSVRNPSDKFMESSSKFKVPSTQRKSINCSEFSYDTASNSRLELSTDWKQKNELERTLLNSLFRADKEESFVLPKRKLITVKSAGIYGQPVSEPLNDPVIEHKTRSLDLQLQTEYEKEEEDRYQATRKAVKEYHAMMKEYYQSAVDAYSKGDHVRAKKLVEQGYFFHKKAREADKESSEMILEPRNVKAQDAMVLDLHEYGAKEAIRLLKCHLSSLSGILSKCLKVIIDTNEEDSSKGSRRRLVLRLLERESIKWVEEENAGTILIQLDCINRKQLSFVKN